jgi:hypothetical protein
MSISASDQMGAPLGVGSIVAQSFSILFRHLFSVVVLALAPTLIGVVISGLLLGWNAAVGGQPEFTDSSIWLFFALSLMAQLVLSGLTTALLVQLAYDAKLERPIRVDRYVGPAISAAVPIALLGLVAGILAGLAAIALLIPGLWVLAVFSMMAPAVVIEKIGFRGLGRSIGLTRGYRWPIVGAMIIIMILGIVTSLVAAFLVDLIRGATGEGNASLIIAVGLYALFNALGSGLYAISTALIYARLREMKEGISVRDIVAVFD